MVKAKEMISEVRQGFESFQNEAYVDGMSNFDTPFSIQSEIGLDLLDKDLGEPGEDSLPVSSSSRKLNSELNKLMIEAHEKVRESGVPNFQGCKIEVPSTLNHDYLREKLKRYPDIEVCELLRFGLPVGFQGNIKNRRCKNHSGALEHPDAINKFLSVESGRQTLLGPFDKNPFRRDLIISPLNTVPKRDSQERRIIVDLSYPRIPGKSVNGGIDKDEYLGQAVKLVYPSVDDLVNIIRKKGRGCALFKRDLKGAYRNFPVDPGDLHLLGYKWEGKYYVDRVLTMGLRSAAFLCQRITNAVAYICEQEGVDVINFQDDFGGAEIWEKAEEAFRKLGEIIGNCGIAEAILKACEPAYRMIFLGILLDTLKMTLEVTEDRQVEILQEVETWLARQTASKKQLQRLIGKLQFVATCVRPGRLFISRMLAALRGVSDNEVIVLGDEFKKDIKWWKCFLDRYNGVSMIPEEIWSNPDELIATDACLAGAGGVCGSEFFHCPFPEWLIGMHINALELITVMVALKVWAKVLVGKNVVLNCDNMVSVQVINSGRTKDAFLQNCLREILFIAAEHEIQVKAVHLAGVDNRIPDMLSRWEISSQARDQFLKKNQGLGMKQKFVYAGLFSFSHDW